MRAAEDHVTWRVINMATQRWDSSVRRSNTTSGDVGQLQVASNTCTKAGLGPTMTAWKGNIFHNKKWKNHNLTLINGTLRQKALRRRACLCLGRWRKSCRIRRWSGANTASCARPVRWLWVSCLHLHHKTHLIKNNCPKKKLTSLPQHLTLYKCTSSSAHVCKMSWLGFYQGLFISWFPLKTPAISSWRWMFICQTLHSVLFLSLAHIASAGPDIIIIIIHIMSPATLLAVLASRLTSSVLAR